MRLVKLLVAATLVSASFGALMGIDFGSEFIKVAAPKNNNIDIVLNEQSHRKSHNYIGFRGEERFFAEDAKNLAPRFPDNMFGYVNQLVGIPHNDTEAQQRFREQLHVKATLEQARKPSLGANQDDDDLPAMGTIALRTGSNPNTTYHVETLMGMIFGHIRFIAKKDTGSKFRDATVTVPASTTLRQRQAIIDAAALAGVNVVGTVHVTTAVALQYGMKNRGFGNSTFTLMVVDMGASHVDVGVYEFSPPKKSGKKRKADALGTMETKAIVSDNTIGGRAFDGCLAELIEKRFVDSTKLPAVLTADTLPKRKAVIALMRAANKAKEVLSANKVANVIAENMAPNKDFPTSISREDFETTCAGIFQRSLNLVTRAADDAGVSLSSLDALEVVGGASRVPKLIDGISQLRGKPVDRTLNSDESAAIGAAFLGGVATQRFRVESFTLKESVFAAMPQVSSIAFGISPKSPEEPVKFRPLFSESSKIGQLKTVTVNRTANFNVTVALNTSSGDLVSDFTVRVTGVDSGLRSTKYYADVAGLETDILNHPNNSHSVRVEFRASESGLIVVESAELRVSYVDNVTRQVKVNMTEEELEVESNKTRTSVIAQHEVDEKRRKAKLAKKANATNSTETANATDDTASEDATESPAEDVATEAVNETEIAEANARFEKKLEKALAKMRRHKYVPETTEEMKRSVQNLKTRNSYTFPTPLTRGDKKILRGVLEDFDFADEQRRLLAAAKNDLEGYLVWVRGDGVLDNATLKESGALTAEATEAIEAALKKASDWVDDDATDSTPREEYEGHLKELRSVVKISLKQKKAPEAAEEQQTQPSDESSQNTESADGASGDSTDGDDASARTESTDDVDAGSSTETSDTEL